MDKKYACHRLAEISEEIYDIEEQLLILQVNYYGLMIVKKNGI